MRQVVWVTAALALAVALAGCSDAGPKDAGATATTGSTTGSAAASSSSAPSSAPPSVDVGQGKGAIDGSVVDEAVRPIAGALVKLQPLGVSGVTDAQGRFAFEGLEPGAFVVNATHDGFRPGQSTVDVAAGKPAVVKLTLVATQDQTPRVVQQTARLFVSSSYCAATQCGAVVSGNVEGFGSDSKYFEVDKDAVAFQAEVSWEPTLATLGDGGTMDCVFYGDDPAGELQALRVTVSGPSPLVVRVPGIWINDEDGAPVSTHNIHCEMASATGEVPVGVMANQQIDLYLHGFYNFEPDPAWSFVRDGAYPEPA